MIIKEQYNQSVFVADFTQYNADHPDAPAPNTGVLIDINTNSLIPCFCIKNNKSIPFESVNIERNPALLKKKDGTKASQCECLFYAIRHDGGKPWMLFVELKYCQPKNIMDRAKEALGQAKKTYIFIRDNKAKEIDIKDYKPYFAISIPGQESTDPFQAFYFTQAELLKCHDECGGAIVYFCNGVEILTPAHIKKIK